MRKIFSTVLVATALLFSMQANAAGNVAKIGGNEYATIEAAFQAAEDGQTITLINPCIQTTCIVLNDARKLTLDMNGYNITMDDPNSTSPWNFKMQHASLNVIGKGSILNTTDTCLGAYVAKTGTYKWAEKYYNKAGAMIANFHLFGSTNPEDSAYTCLTIGKDVTVGCEDGKMAVDVYQIDANNKVAYGVIVKVFGIAYGQKYGIQVSGTVRGTTGQVPYIYVGPEAEVYSQPDATESCGVYVGGYAKVVIEGEVHAATGVYVKSGDVTLNNATITSDWTGEYSIPEGKGSGVEAGGSAVVVESNKSYSGNIKVTVTGDTKVEGASGFALDERITNTPGDVSYVSNVTIESGTFTTDGTNKTITIEQATAEGDKVTAYGGTYDDNAAIDLGLTKSGTVVLTTKDENGNNVYVITKTDEPTTPVFENDKDLNNTNASDYVTIAAADQVITAEDAKAAYLVINAGKKVTIKKNAKLTVGQIVLNYTPANPGVTPAVYSNITVEAGAKLVVTGTQGIYSPSVECLKIEADAASQGILVFNPDVKGNKSPNATVEYWDKGGKIVADDEKYWSMFSCPFAKVDTVYTAASDALFLQYIDLEAKMWKNFASKKDFANRVEAFQMISTTNNNEFDYFNGGGHKIVLKGQLQGNISGKFSLKKGFNYIGNGYLANMDGSQMINLLRKASSKVYPIFYTYDVLEGFQDHSAYSAQAGNINGMGGIVLYATEDIPEITLDYKTLIWNNSTNK